MLAIIRRVSASSRGPMVWTAAASKMMPSSVQSLVVGRLLPSSNESNLITLSALVRRRHHHALHTMGKARLDRCVVVDDSAKTWRLYRHDWMIEPHVLASHFILPEQQQYHRFASTFHRASMMTTAPDNDQTSSRTPTMTTTNLYYSTDTDSDQEDDDDDDDETEPRQWGRQPHQLSRIEELRMQRNQDDLNGFRARAHTMRDNDRSSSWAASDSDHDENDNDHSTLPNDQNGGMAHHRELKAPADRPDALREQAAQDLEKLQERARAQQQPHDNAPDNDNDNNNDGPPPQQQQQQKRSYHGRAEGTASSLSARRYATYQFAPDQTKIWFSSTTTTTTTADGDKNDRGDKDSSHQDAVGNDSVQQPPDQDLAAASSSSSSSSQHRMDDDENAATTSPGDDPFAETPPVPRSYLAHRKIRADLGHFRARARTMRTGMSTYYDDFKSDPRGQAGKSLTKFGEMFRKYGPVFVGTYFGVYVTTLGLLWAGVEVGALDPVRLFSMIGVDSGETNNTVELVSTWMRSHSITEPYADTVEKNPRFANLAVAWIAVKFTEPLRLMVAVPMTPRVARWTGYRSKAIEEEEKSLKAAAREALTESPTGASFSPTSTATKVRELTDRPQQKSTDAAVLGKKKSHAY